MEKLLSILTAFGNLVVTFLPASAVGWLQATLPIWAIGLIVAVVLAFVLKVVTNIVFKVILWASVIILILILLESFNVPVLRTLAGWGS